MIYSDTIRDHISMVILPSKVWRNIKLSYSWNVGIQFSPDDTGTINRVVIDQLTDRFHLGETYDEN